MTELYTKLIAAVAPAIVLAVMMIRRDKVRSEPIPWLLKSAGLGVVAGIAVFIFGLIVYEPVEENTLLGTFYGAFVMAALPEEAIKLRMLVIIASVANLYQALPSLIAKASNPVSREMKKA